MRVPVLLQHRNGYGLRSLDGWDGTGNRWHFLLRIRRCGLVGGTFGHGLCVSIQWYLRKSDGHGHRASHRLDVVDGNLFNMVFP